LADSKTVGSAAPLQAEGWHVKGGLDEEPTEEELKEVIREQRSMSGAFDGVTSWKEYGKIRWRSSFRKIEFRELTVVFLHRVTAKIRLQKDHRFKQGQIAGTLIPFETTMLPEWAALSGFWKFKIDPVSKWCIATGISGKLTEEVLDESAELTKSPTRSRRCICV
jgi:hypothetical protein